MFRANKKLFQTLVQVGSVVQAPLFETFDQDFDGRWIASEDPQYEGRGGNIDTTYCVFREDVLSPPFFFSFCCIRKVEVGKGRRFRGLRITGDAEG